MVKTKAAYILATAFLSGIAAVLSFVSLGTEQWVVGEGKFHFADNEPLSEIHYGLFGGTYLRKVAGPVNFEITPTCLLSENACAYLCREHKEAREDELKKVIDGNCESFTCPYYVRRTNYIEPLAQGNCRTPEDKREYINAGLYISTIVFLCISGIFGIIAAVLSVWNTAANPVEVYLSIYGLYIYNGIACVSCMLTLVLWGAMFGSTLVNNVGILETIQGQMDSTANLGYSYWLNLPSFLLYFTSIGILFVRQHLISQEPEIKIHTTTGDKDVGEIMIY